MAYVYGGRPGRNKSKKKARTLKAVRNEWADLDRRDRFPAPGPAYGLSADEYRFVTRALAGRSGTLAKAAEAFVAARTGDTYTTVDLIAKCVGCVA